MARKEKAPPSKPSKAYLVSFGDTMTALLAFFIVLNSFAKEQTGANMYTGTGSFMNTSKNIGLPGGALGDRSQLVFQREHPAPIYAVESKDKGESNDNLGPDDDPDNQRIIDRQTEEFKRFLNDVNKSFEVQEEPPTRSQIVFDSFENLNPIKANEKASPLGPGALRLTSEAMMKLGRDDFRLEVVVWANMPSQNALVKATDKAVAIREQIGRLFRLTPQQNSRITVSAKPWLFSDAARPRISLVVSKLDLESE